MICMAFAMSQRVSGSEGHDEGKTNCGRAGCVLALGVATAAQNRGKAKAEGKVVGDQRQAAAGCHRRGGHGRLDKPFQQAKTNNKGEWRIENLAAGKWKFYFGGKEGLEEKGVDAQVGEAARWRSP